MTAPFQRVQKPIENFTDEDWITLYKRLRLYAHKRFWWVADVTRGAIDAEDLVQDAIKSLLSGQRVKPESVELDVFLLMSIRGRASHIGAQNRHGREVAMDDELRSDPSFLAHHDEFQQAYDLRQLHGRIREIVRDDETLRSIVEVWFLDPGLKPQDIAERIRVPIVEIRNAQKRLRKRLEKLRSKFND